MSATVTTTTTIPFFLRHSIITLEPMAALHGAWITYCHPASYLDIMTRGIQPYAANTKFLYTTAAGSWLWFAFLEAVVLRIFDDVRLWRLSCAGMLLSDIFYCISAVEAMGGWALWTRIGDWTATDWGVFLGTVPFVAVRICIVLGIGLKKTRTRAGPDSNYKK